MKWKDLTIGKKLGFGFGVLLVCLAISAVLSFTGVNGIVKNAGEVIKGNKLDGLLAQREVDHLNWANKVSALLNDEKVVTLDVETDPHKCGFGQWYYGDGRKEAEALVPELKTYLEKMELPHRLLHESAEDIGRIFKQADPELGNFLREKKTDHLAWAHRVKDVFVDASIKKIDAVMDPQKCSFGKWYYSGEVAALRAKNPEIAALLDRIEVPHRKLHESAAVIQGLLDQGKRTEASAYYMKNTKPLAYETLDAIEGLVQWHNTEMQNMKQAQNIYAGKTSPNLETVQTLLNKIRETARENIMTDEIMLDKANITRSSVLIASVIAITFGLVIGFIITRALTGPIQKSADLANTIARGDLTQTIDIDQKDEIGILANAMRTMTNNLKKLADSAEAISNGDLTIKVKPLSDKDVLGHSLKSMVSKLGSIMEDINTSSSNVAAGSEEMSSTSQSMSQGATEQASSLEEITSSMNEIGSQTKQNAENAGQRDPKSG